MFDNDTTEHNGPVALPAFTIREDVHKPELGAANIDFETRSPVDLTKTGTGPYCAHPHTDVWCLAWQLPSIAAPDIWYRGEPLEKLEPLFAHIRAGGTVAGWHLSFEFAIWAMLRRRDPRWPELHIEQCGDTMVRALAMALPGSLEKCAQALGVSEEKDKEGSRLMMQMSKPRKPRKDEAADALLWWDDETRLHRLGAYCVQDVRTERAVGACVRPLSDMQRRTWLLDQTINRRGIYVDAKSCRALMPLLDAEVEKANVKVRELTDGKVSGPKSNQALLQWANETAGFQTDSLAKGVVGDLLKYYPHRLPPVLKDVLVERQKAYKSSVAKIPAMLNCRDADGRARNQFQYHKPTTGRWASRLIQVQNLVRFPKGWNVPRAEAIFEMAQQLASDPARLAATLRFTYGEPLDVVSWCLRALLTAAPGNELFSADFSNIEGRMLAWLAREEWKLEAFRAYDTGHGEDLYCVAYGRSFGIDPKDVDDDQRQLGKVQELACIAEGELVLTDKGLVPIELITLRHKVWDGADFVAHSGVVEKGIRDTFEYDGLRATGNHIVFVEGQSQPIPFEQAAASGKRLARSAIDRTALRLGIDNTPGETLYARLDRGLCGRAVPWLRLRRLGALQQSFAGKKQRVPNVLPSAEVSVLATETRDRDAFSLRKSERCGLSSLWRTRHSFRLRKYASRGSMDIREFGPRSLERNRPDRQQRALCAGQLALCDANGKFTQPTALENNSSRRGMVAFYEPARGSCDASLSGSGLSQRSNYRSSVQGCFRPPEELAWYRSSLKRTRVYDILNAGPRHRYTVAGRLVHNSGYQGGLGAYKNMGANYDVLILPSLDDAPPNAKHVISEAQAEDLKVAWREKHPAIVQLWYDTQDAAIAAVNNPGDVFDVRGRYRYRRVEDYLWCQLPSGRALCYPAPEVGKENGYPKLSYMGEHPITGQWTRNKIYGGMLVQNVTQAAAADVLIEAMFRLEAAGLPVVLHVHDEIVSEIAAGTRDLAEFEALMNVVPDWADGLPLAAKGWRGDRYRK